jgi:hypothetical protein
MGGSQSLQIPGGGTEGYHVLRVISIIINKGNFKRRRNQIDDVSFNRYKMDRRVSEPDLNLSLIS